MRNTQALQSFPYGIVPPAFRLPSASRVGAVHLQVSDLRQSLAYYEKVLGLRGYKITDSTALLGPERDDRVLVALDSKSGVTPRRRGTLGLYHFAILLPDRASLGRFAEHLASLNVRAGMADHLVSESLYLYDPDGLGIEVYADRPRESWPRRDRELAMATDPLDVENLIAAGAGEKWAGVPPGTTMGHMHLHVGTLQGAEEFYHRALGFDKIVWSYPGALFMSAGGYHHHLATNVWSAGPAPKPHEAQLLEWELIVPSTQDVAAIGRSVMDGGYRPEAVDGGLDLADPWGTRLHVRAEERAPDPHGSDDE